ncbi:hypothetical protein FA10DRAFT_263792 [Acaromyces ingoldii]|uniref:Uncharacterized protein n=1 Tax=Acaromyces ingoldii TaxID=215250 RepID=A0A316YV18_9BASI|nr:hypothetical protein FA10DRAFT_263792 [Acaromyces ingoldii]PWN93091.1 hypothetical protein FA10DRAFT_263792 [Acaromyces ingoldii]
MSAERKSKWDEQGEAGAKPGPDAAAAAAAAVAAKIAAQYGASSSASSGGHDARSPSAGDVRKPDLHDAEFTHDIEINDQRNRYMLTKGQTQKQLEEETGASVTTKGTWYPDKSLATAQDPPLFLHISATTKEILDKAIAAINELMAQDVPQLIEDRHAKRLEYEAQRRAHAPPGRREWPEEKVFIGLDSMRNFNVRAKTVGPGGVFVKYIQGETGCRVQIKGLGSAFKDPNTGMESQEPMHIHLTGPDAAKVAEAKELAMDLLDTVRTRHAEAQQATMAQWGPHTHMQAGMPGYGSPGAYGQGAQQGYGAYPGWDQQQQAQMQPQQPQQAHPPQPQGEAPPLPDDAPPPPPPEDEAPPPPAEPAKKKKTPEEEAMDKYWNDYITWEKSYVEYHKRLPTKDEGGQDVPPEYRTAQNGR